MSANSTKVAKGDSTTQRSTNQLLADTASESLPTPTLSGNKRTRDELNSELGSSDFSPPSKRMCVEDAIQYIEQVKRTFVGGKENVYFEFLRMMGLFRDGKLDVSSVCKRVRTLFKGYDYLIKGFNVFLPPEAKMSVDGLGHEALSNAIASDQYFKQALDLINAIKNRYIDNPSVYESFLEVLFLFQEQVLDSAGVCERVKGLIGEHDDLWQQFLQYLPRNISSGTSNGYRPGEDYDMEIDEEAIPHGDQTHSYNSQKKYKWRYGPQYDGPSYEIAPEGPSKNYYTQRTSFENEILNDDLICVGAKHSKWNRDITLSEKSFGEYAYLKQAEDALVELEVSLSAAKCFVEFLEELKKKIDGKIDVEITKEDLKQIYRGLLKQVYATKRGKIVKSLRSNPVDTVPVVLTRFQGLLQTWTKQKEDLLVNVRAAQEVAYWEAFRRNLNAFRVSEAKTLSEKQILVDALQHFKYNSPFVANLNQTAIHKEIFKLVITQTQLPKDKVKEFWNKFIIPLFNLQKKEEKKPEDTTSSAEENTIDESTTAAVPPNFEVSGTKDENQMKEIPKSHRKRKNKQKIIFYANATVMIFLRFYILMYDRLLLAKRVSAQKRSLDIRRRELNLNYVTSDKTTPGLPFIPVENEELDGSAQYEEPVLYPFQTTEIVDDYYERFMELVQNILEEHIEQQTYEEELMKYLGFDSYALFTFIHLFEKLEAKLYDCIEGASSQALVSSFQYELNRAHPFQDDVYFKNVNQVISFTEDIYEIHVNKNDRCCRIYKTDNVVRHHPLEKWTSQGFSFLNDYMQDKVDCEDYVDGSNRPLHVFLNRNKSKVKNYLKHCNCGISDNTAIYNGSECHLCLVTMKLRFKEGTSDVFVRYKGSNDHTNTENESEDVSKTGHQIDKDGKEELKEKESEEKSSASSASSVVENPVAMSDE